MVLLPAILFCAQLQAEVLQDLHCKDALYVALSFKLAGPRSHPKNIDCSPLLCRGRSPSGISSDWDGNVETEVNSKQNQSFAAVIGGLLARECLKVGKKGSNVQKDQLYLPHEYE